MYLYTYTVILLPFVRGSRGGRILLLFAVMSFLLNSITFFDPIMHDIVYLGHVFVVPQLKNAEVIPFFFNYVPGWALLVALHA